MYPPIGFRNRLRRYGRPFSQPRSLLIVTSSGTVTGMFKFDFVQDGGNEQTQTARNEEKEPDEPVLTEISLLELVCTTRLDLLWKLQH